jgi:hypothetical protein
VTLASDDGSCEAVSHGVFFCPRPAPSHLVRFFYVVPRDGGEAELFQTPDGRSGTVETAVARIATGALILQSFCADILGGQTFALDDQGGMAPAVHVVRSWLTRAEIHAIDWSVSLGGLGYDHIREVVHKELGDQPNCIPVALMSMTHYDPARGKAVAQCALGSGALALFGSGNLHTWPASVADIPRACLDLSAIPAHLNDDCAGRGRAYWANFATGLGATLHELGHAFGLYHTREGIMARGFDDLNRYLSAVEPGTGAPIPPWPGGAERGAFWARESALVLRASPHFLPPAQNLAEPRAVPPVSAPCWVRDDKEGFWMCSDPGTRRWVEYSGPDDGVSPHKPIFFFEQRPFPDNPGVTYIADDSRGIHVKLGMTLAQLSQDRGQSWMDWSAGWFATVTPVPIFPPDPPAISRAPDGGFLISPKVFMVEVLTADEVIVAAWSRDDLAACQGCISKADLWRLCKQDPGPSKIKAAIVDKTVSPEVFFWEPIEK